jgi:hypothetical protein
MTYGIMFWGNSSSAEKVFKLQKRAVRIMKGCGLRESCKEHFRHMKIFPLRSQYIHSLMMFVVKNREIFDTNNAHYEIKYTHEPGKSGNIWKRDMALRVFNALPNTLKDNFNDIKKFKDNLKKFLYIRSFYTLDEFF